MSESIEQRVERLERELAALKRGEICVRRIEIGDQGTPARCVIEAEQGRPVVRLIDGSGEVRAKLGITADGPGLTLTDEAGHTRAWMGFAKDAIRVGFADEAGNSRAFFGVTRSGPTAKFYDGDQSVVWSAP